MATVDPVFAVLASAVYENGRVIQNRLTNLPEGVTPVGNPELAHFRDDATGFEAGAYLYNGKVVISYAGTLVGLEDLATDAMLGLGITEAQMKQAAEFYEKVKQQYGDNIVFTGHSLGGGLAALMGVFFNKEAITFDPAPFRLAATEANAQKVASYLSGRGYGIDADLASYATSEQLLAVAVPELIPSLINLGLIPYVGAPLVVSLAAKMYPTTIRGEEKNTGVALRGELLSGDVLDQLRIAAGDVQYVEHGGVDSNSLLDLHSINLLAAFLIEPSLAEASKQLPNLATLLLDGTLYEHPARHRARVKIVIAYTGTNGAVDWPFGNVPAAASIPSTSQVENEDLIRSAA